MLTKSQVRKLEIKRKLRYNYLLKNRRDINELSKLVGVTPQTVRMYLSEILEQLKERHEEEEEHDYHLIREGFEKTIQLATDEYLRSRKDSQQTRKETKEVICQNCNGTKYKDNNICEVCEGKGVLQQTKETLITVGKTGDPNLLRMRHEAQKELAKLLNLYPDANTNINVSGQITHEHTEALQKVPTEQLMQLLTDYDKLLQESKEAVTIDVEIQKPEMLEISVDTKE